jgi:hypothetical protein
LARIEQSGRAGITAIGEGTVEEVYTTPQNVPVYKCYTANETKKKTLTTSGTTAKVFFSRAFLFGVFVFV